VGAPGLGDSAGKVFLFEAETGALLLTLRNPLLDPGDRFGAAIAAAGTTIAIGAPGSEEGAGRVFLFDAITGLLLRILQENELAPGDGFGSMLAVNLTQLLIGAPGDSERVPGGGAVYAIDLLGDTRRVLRKGDARPQDHFGMAVAVAGRRVLVGSPLDDVAMPDGGAAYLYSNGTLEAVFRKRLSSSSFGASVTAASADVLVGAPRGGRGAGLVARYDGTSGETLATVDSPSGGDPRFGFALASLGGEIVAGAPFEDSATGADVGATRVFDGTALRHTLAAPDPVPGDQLGFSLATVGPDVLVGVPLARTLDSGIALLFDGATGARRVTYQKPVPTTGDFFGAAVAAEGESVLIGAPFDSTAAMNAGAAYLFQRETAELERSFQGPAAQAGDLFGAAVALGATRVVIGAPMADGGAVYVFDRATGNLVLTLISPTPDPGDQFGHAVALAGNDILVGAHLDDTGAPDTGAAYLFEAATGALRQTFRNPAQGKFDNFGFAVAAIDSGLLIGAPGPSRVYLFRPANAGAGSGTALGALTRGGGSGSGAGCGNGIVEGSEACDDGNTADSDDCRNDCTLQPCCALDPQEDARCDDGNPCTDDINHPQTGCTSTDNGTCCNEDGDCGGGTCRVCVGCFLYPWDCCGGGSACLALAPDCGGTECLEGAFCRCEGGLSCAGEPVPARTDALFADACDELRENESLAPSGDPGRDELRAAKVATKKARRMVRKAARTTRKLLARRALSPACGQGLLVRLKGVKQAIPRGKRLRRCVLAR
jgi:cysteine-rich repeat protein